MDTITVITLSSITGILLLILCVCFTGTCCLLCMNCKKSHTSANKINNDTGNIFLPTRISFECYRPFNEQLDKLKGCNTINVIIDCYGGSAIDADRMCFDILNHKLKYGTKFIAKIKDKAFSAGALIALCCDVIQTTKFSHFSPCDTQVYSKKLDKFLPCVDLEEIINIKGNKVDEEFIHLRNQYKRVQIVMKELFAKMIDNSVVTNNNKNLIYENFFSGKFLHAHMFSINDVIGFGIQIHIIDNINEQKIEQIDDIKIDIIDKGTKIKTAIETVYNSLEDEKNKE
jgi:hypothetical protein